MKEIVLLCPEYKTPEAPLGGIASVVDSVFRMIDSQPEFCVRIVSTRSWNRSELNRRLASPRTWISGPKTEIRDVDGNLVTYVGTNWSELEFMRYRKSKILTSVLHGADVVIAISGTPAYFGVLRSFRGPTMGQAATFLRDERGQTPAHAGKCAPRLRLVMNRIVERLDHENIRIPHVFVSFNTEVQRKAEALGVLHTMILPPSVDSRKFALGVDASPSSPPYVLSVARFGDGRKNIAGLIRSYKISRESWGLTHQLILAGASHLTQAESNLIIELELEADIIIRESPTADELVALYQNAELFLLASFEEGFGIVFAEALACGTPFLASKTVGAQQLVSQGAPGVLINLGPSFEEEMARTLYEQTLRPLTRQDRASNRAIFDSQFSDKAVQTKFIAALRGLLTPTENRATFAN